MEERHTPQHAWPTMRADVRNTGVYPHLAVWEAPRETLQSRRYHTDGPIFSTPIVGEDDTIYVGSGDHAVYAWNPVKHALRWSADTKEAIDCAAAIDDAHQVYVAGCDGVLRAYNDKGKERWSFDVIHDRERPTPSTIYWWEGNVALGPDGHVYAGNDDFYLYSFTRDGSLRWQFPAGLNVWSQPAFFGDLVIFAAFDFYVYALDTRTGELVWKTELDNFVVASPAITQKGVVYIGSLGGTLYALDARTGKRMWRTSLNEHIYASCAIMDEDDALYVGDASGVMYAFSLSTHHQLWKFDCGSPIRASASIGPDPTHEHAYRVYCGDDAGLVYAFTPDGSPAWIFDTYRNADVVSHAVNASIALGHTGVVVATIAGDIVWIPYTYAGMAGTRDTSERRVRGSVPEGEHTYTFTNLVFETPPIISSFDLIAIASVEYELTLTCRTDGRVTGTGRVEFGSHEGEDGVTIKRVLPYTFSGTVDEHGAFSVTARDCFFELSAFPIYVDALEFSGVFTRDGVANRSVRLTIEPQSSPFSYIRQLVSLESRTFMWAYLRELWHTPHRLALLRMAARALKVGMRVMHKEVRRAWRLTNDDGRVVAEGTYTQSS